MTGDRYGVLLSSYWTGPTGREIQAKGCAAVILGAYLGSTHHANMIGLYDLPLLYAAADLPVLDGVDGVRYALDCLAEVGYAHYDETASMVWVVEMARVRLGLARHARLVDGDKRHAAILRLYHAARSPLLVARFYERYAQQLALDAPRQGASKPLRSPSEASKQEISRSGDQVGTKERAARRPRSIERPKVPTLAAMVRDELLPRGITDEGDLVEAAKKLAASLHLKYSGSAIRKAIASANAQAAKRRQA